MHMGPGAPIYSYCMACRAPAWPWAHGIANAHAHAHDARVVRVATAMQSAAL